MPVVNAILAEIEQESKTTRKVLERVPQDKLNWKPHEKSMSLGRLAWHLAFIPSRVLSMLGEAAFDMAAAGPTTPPESTDEILAGFDKNYGDIRQYLQSIDDAALREPFTLRRGDRVILSMPKLGVVRAILLNHTYHHRGQLSVYLRLLDVAVPSIYGPTADETV